MTATSLAEVRDRLYGRGSRGAVRSLLESLAPEAAIGPLRLTRSKAKPGRYVHGWFAATVDGRMVPIAVRWLPADGPGDDLGDGGAMAVARGLGVSFRALAAARPADGLSVLVAPHDPEFDHLLDLSDPAHAASVLGAPRIDVAAVRYRPGERHVLRWQAADDAPVFVKLYRKGRSAEAVALARRLAAWFADDGGVVRAAAPAAHLEADDAIVYPLVTGTPLSAGVAAGDPRAATNLRSVGEVLARLHASPPDVAGDLPEHTLAGEVKAVVRAGECVTALLPETGDALRRVLDAILAAGAGHEFEPGFAHGDLKCDHLLAARGRLNLIDFDSCKYGDPALDVGKLLADIRWWARTPGARAGASDALLAGYGADAGTLRRIRTYEALILTKITLRRVRVHEPDWPERTESLLAEAASILAG